MYQNFRRGGFRTAGILSPTFVPAVHPIVCPDTTGFPSRSISTSEFGVTRKKRHVPCFDRSQSSAVMVASRAIIRS